MPLDPELTKIFGDDFTDVFNSAMGKMDDSASLIMQQGLSNAVFDAQKFGVDINKRVSELANAGIAPDQIKKLIDQDLKQAGRIFGNLKNSTKETLSNGINQTGRAGQFEAYKPTDELMWVTVAGHKVCTDCSSRSGQINVLAEWESLGMPGTGWSVCRGYCYCILDPSGKIDREVNLPVEPEKRATVRPKDIKLTDIEKKYAKIYGLNKRQIADYKKIMRLDTKTAGEMLKRKKISRAKVWSETVKAREKLMRLGKTKDVYYNKTTGMWDKNRLLLHKKLARDIVNKGKKAGRGEIPEMLMTGGYPGSGKSTMLNQAFPGWKKRFVHLDSDAVKTLLAEFDGIEKLGWRAYSYHDEADNVLKLALRMARNENRHILLDQTMKNSSKVLEQIGIFNDLGYSVSTAFADLPIEQAIERAIARFFGESGRFVDPLYILTHGTRNIESFNKSKDIVSRWVHYSTDVPLGADAIAIATYP